MNRGDCTIAVLTALSDAGADPWSEAHIWPGQPVDDNESGRSGENSRGSSAHTAEYYRRQSETADMYYGFALDATEDGSAAMLVASAHVYADDPEPDRPGGGKRQAITEFSRQSRRRLQTLLASVPRSGFSADRLLFITLTYHNDWPETAAEQKAHLYAWRRRIERAYGEIPMLWRLEFQGRGAPHWHVLMFAPEELVPEYGSTSDSFPLAETVWFAWHDLVAPGDLAHLIHGVDVRQADSWNGAMYYLSKYMAKPEMAIPGGSVGRVWGIWRKNLLGIVWRRWNLSYVQFIKLRRVLRRACRYRRGDYKLRGMVCFLGWADVRRLLNYYELALPDLGSPRYPGRCGAVFADVRPRVAGDEPVASDLARSGQPVLFDQREYATAR